MTHISHAATMDQVYRYQRYIYDFTRKYYLLGRDTLLRGLNIPDGARVLEVGCGTGRNLILAARANPQALFYGFDISRVMLDAAQAKASRSAVGERTFVATGDAETFNARQAFGVDGFNRVFLSYTLSMIPDWERALVNAMDQLQENGSVHIVDFGTMHRWPQVLRKPMLGWLARFHASPRADLEATAHRLAHQRGYDVRIAHLGGGYTILIEISRSPETARGNSGRTSYPEGFGKPKHALQP